MIHVWLQWLRSYRPGIETEYNFSFPLSLPSPERIALSAPENGSVKGIRQ